MKRSCERFGRGHVHTDSGRRPRFRLLARDLDNVCAKVVIPRLGGDGFVTLYTQLSNTWVALGYIYVWRSCTIYVWCIVGGILHFIYSHVLVIERSR
jgi:hypothetical protein